jgi:predicted phosphodiesterase
MTRTVVLGDLHLVRQTPAGLGRDLAAVLERHAGDRVVVAGDLFDLASDAPHGERARAVTALMEAQPVARAALAGFLDRGGELTLVGGNHDAEIEQPDVAEALRDALLLHGDARSRLCVAPWFVRDRGVHVEHGHYYDPDNAPAHPLVAGQRSLGVHFSAEFMHPTGAHRFLEKTDGTPLTLLVSAFRWYGVRAPYVIYRYFHAAFTALARSGRRFGGDAERRLGEQELESFAAATGHDLDLVRRMVGLGAEPTMSSAARTFARLYLDRVTAVVVAGAGLGAIAGGHEEAGVAAVGLGGLLMLVSQLSGRDRYRGTVVDRLARAAAGIGEQTDAALVVMGHTHREALGERYANTGSFAFPRGAPGRPYLVIEHGPHGPRAERAYQR